MVQSDQATGILDGNYCTGGKAVADGGRTIPHRPHQTARPCPSLYSGAAGHRAGRPGIGEGEGRVGPSDETAVAAIAGYCTCGIASCDRSAAGKPRNGAVIGSPDNVGVYDAEIRDRCTG